MAAGGQKKIICRIKGEIVVAYGRLPFPAHTGHSYTFAISNTFQNG